MSEEQGHEERMAGFVSRFPAGPPGKKGEPGEPGTVPRTMVKAFLWFTAVLLVLFVILAAGVIHLAGQGQHLTEQNRHLTEKTAQLTEQNARTLRKLNEQAAANARIRCAALVEEIAVPIGMPIKGHESRVYDSRQRAIDISRARHLGCHLTVKGDQ